jgi:beta-lactamase superfamily II metal-dependent hydrolase
MNRVAVLISAAAVLIAAAPAAQTPPPPSKGQPPPNRSTKNLEIYVADTEGGKAALFVAPSGQTVLVDSGNPGPRDGERIVAMLGDAGVTRIDYLISTHYHVDHVGGLPELAKRIPIGHYIDHGPSVEAKPQVQGFDEAYTELRAKAKHTVVKPGDRVPVAGLDWRIVTSAGQVLKTPLPGGGRPNPACAQFQKRPEPATPDDNAASVGSVVAYGQFRLIDLGDLLWNVEGDLMCPNNPVGQVDLYMVTHHGLAQSGSDPLVHGVRPRAAVMQNGTRKGGAVQAFEIMRRSPGLEDIWQLHWSYAGGIEHNAAGVFIANVDDNATIASVLTAPPGRGGPGRGAPGGAGAPPGAMPGAPPGSGPPAGAGPPPNIVPPGAPPAGPPPTGIPPGAGGTPPAQPPASMPPPPMVTPPGQAPAGPAGRGQGPGGGRGNAAAAHSPAYYIKISAQADGTFTITNTRNGFSKTYVKRAS